MNAFSICLIVLSIPLLLQSIPKVFCPEPEKYGIVRMPKIFAIIGMISWCISGIALLCFLSKSTHLSLKNIALAASVIALLCNLIYSSIDITYDENGFRVKRFLGRAKFHTYAEIKGIIPGETSNTTLCLQKEKIFLAGWAVGQQSFLDYAEMQYSAITGAFCMPDFPSPFYNYPLSLLVLCASLWIFSLVAVAIFLPIAFRTAHMTQTDLTYDTVCITSIEYKNNKYQLNTQDVCFAISEDVLTKDSKRVLENADSLSLGYNPQEGNGTNFLYEIWEIKDLSGKEILRFGTSKEYYLKEAREAAAISFVFFLLTSFICPLSVYIYPRQERHPILTWILYRDPKYL